MKGEEKVPFDRKPKYQHKAFFWSLNKNSTIQSNSESQNRHNTEVCDKKS
ncbi:hypothetical protein MTsPCn9_13250 [Croceitalea sp. MTPC9]|nr:hypothetical protein MTsPCn6_15880 [Croceitalea sp. MTPC6]GMN16389.1 hypothetical protein MTsPCn9_13250 [Croceitalea sp. MTPC9]